MPVALSTSKSVGRECWACVRMWEISRLALSHLHSHGPRSDCIKMSAEVSSRGSLSSLLDPGPQAVFGC